MEIRTPKRDKIVGIIFPKWDKNAILVPHGVLHFVPMLVPLWGSCSHFVPTLFPFCSHSCPTLYLVPASFPLCSTLFLILSRFGVLIFALFPLCLIFVPLVLGPISFPVSILVFLWGSCSRERLSEGFF